MTTSISQFAPGFGGELLRDGDAGYDEARHIFNSRLKGRPELIARATGVADVERTMRWAHETGTPVAIRGGGHMDGYAAPDGAVLLDLSQLRGIEVDGEARVARAEAGVLLGELDAATQAHGLATTAGTVTHTGVAGLTLGGGVGFLMRRFGVTVDNLLSCEVVTTAGKRLTASEEENADLFWALRGGGGNFAVVTRFEYRLHELGPDVARGLMVYPLEQAPAVLRNLDEYMRTAPRQAMIIAALTQARGLPVPPDLAGKPALILIIGYTGDPDEAEAALAPVLECGEPALSKVERTAYTTLNGTLNQLAPWDHRWHLRGGYLEGLGDKVIEGFVASAEAAPTTTDVAPPNATIAVWSMGGAMDDFAEDSVAFSRVGARWFYEAVGAWKSNDDDDAHIAWADDIDAFMAPHRLSNGYINLGTSADPNWLRNAYGPEKYARLTELKREWDPHNLLRFNKNIEPE